MSMNVRDYVILCILFVYLFFLLYIRDVRYYKFIL